MSLPQWLLRTYDIERDDIERDRLRKKLKKGNNKRKILKHRSVVENELNL